MEKYMEMLQPYLDKLPGYALNVLYAVIILILGRIIAGVIRSVAIKVMKKSKVDETLISFSSSLSYIALMTMVIIAAINQLGIQTTSIVAVLGAAGLAVGLALQGSLSNFAAGVLMIIFKPIKVGDFIQGAGELGEVLDIEIFTTTLKTPDCKKVIIPNAKLAGDNITNFTVLGKRRLDLSVGISYNDNMQKARDLLLDLIKSDERVLKEPAPFVGVTELGDSSVNLVVRPWCKSEDYWDIHFDMTQKIKETLDDNNISIPFPQRDINVYHKTPLHDKEFSHLTSVDESINIVEKADD